MIVQWTQERADAGFPEGALVEFPESMCPPGAQRLWRVAAVGGPTAGADGYHWQTPDYIDVERLVANGDMGGKLPADPIPPAVGAFVDKQIDALNGDF